MKRVLKFGAAAIVGALALSACGGDNTADPTTDPTTAGGETTAAGSEAAVDPGSLETTIKILAPSYSDSSEADWQTIIDKFNEEYPNVTINYQSVAFGEAQNKFKTAAKSGKGAPDILRAEVAWTPEFASLGYLYQLDGTAALENNFLETPLSSNVYEDKTYGVPQVTDTLGLMYNKELFEKAGLDPEAPPTTWEEVAEAAEALKSKAKVDGIYLNAQGYFLMPFIYGEGGDLVDTDAEKILVNSPESVAGVQTAQDLVESGAAVPSSW